MAQWSLTAPNPLLYEINAHVWLWRWSRRAGRPLTLADIPDEALDEISEPGFSLVWLMGVWTKGELGRAIARAHPDIRRACDAALPGWSEEDIIGSPYAVHRYEVSPALGGAGALADLRARLDRRGVGLILDFVPNHVARDHCWVYEHPEYFVSADAAQAAARPADYFLAETKRGALAMAFGKDPYFPGWTDTAQLDYRNAALRAAMIQTLRKIAGQCDGVRCDMAMLVLDDIFARTWGEPPGPVGPPFWPEAIRASREVRPGFLFIAEVYWDLERRLQDLGFDFTYDKGLYDRLRSGDAAGALQAVRSQGDRLPRGVRFIENHDEVPARVAFEGPLLRPAAVLTATLPGMRFFHEGQFDGRTAHLPIQLGRAPEASPDPGTVAFYRRLLAIARDGVCRHGRFRLLDVEEGADGAASTRVLAYQWDQAPARRRVLVVSFASEPLTCRVRLGRPEPSTGSPPLKDDLSESPQSIAKYEIMDDFLELALRPYHALSFEEGRG